VSVPSATAPPFGTRMKGPSALGGDWRRFLHLTWTLSVLDFKLRFFGSVLGYFWQLMRPLMLFGVLYVVFTQFVKLGGGVKYYEAVLLLGVVIYTFFSDATSKSVDSVVQQENLVRKIHFPRMVIPLTAVVTACFNFGLNLITVCIFILIAGVPIQPGWLELIPLVLFLVVFCTGIAMLLSALFVRFRDVQPIWEVLLTVSFYASPVLYPLEIIPNRTVQEILMCNPLAVVLQEARHAVIDPDAMSAAYAIGGTARLLIPIGIVVGVFAIGFWVFNREAPRIAEEL
jgi:ABC-2 type transport system permease protein